MGISRRIEDDVERKRLRQVFAELKLPKDVGFIVRTAASGRSEQELIRDAQFLYKLWKRLEKIAQEPVNLVFLDIQMPDIDGFNLIRRIRSNPLLRISSVPIIAVTALAMDGDRQRCLDAGANAYLSKPIQLRNLLEAIERLMPLIS